MTDNYPSKVPKHLYVRSRVSLHPDLQKHINRYKREHYIETDSQVISTALCKLFGLSPTDTTAHKSVQL